MSERGMSSAVRKFRGKAPDQHQLLVSLLVQAGGQLGEKFVGVNRRWDESCRGDLGEGGRREGKKRVSWSKNLLRVRSISPRQIQSPPNKLARFPESSCTPKPQTPCDTPARFSFIPRFPDGFCTPEPPTPCDTTTRFSFVPIVVEQKLEKESRNVEEEDNDCNHFICNMPDRRDGWACKMEKLKKNNHELIGIKKNQKHIGSNSNEESTNENRNLQEKMENKNEYEPVDINITGDCRDTKDNHNPKHIKLGGSLTKNKITLDERNTRNVMTKMDCSPQLQTVVYRAAMTEYFSSNRTESQDRSGQTLNSKGSPKRSVQTLGIPDKSCPSLNRTVSPNRSDITLNISKGSPDKSGMTLNIRQTNKPYGLITPGPKHVQPIFKSISDNSKHKGSDHNHSHDNTKQGLKTPLVSSKEDRLFEWKKELGSRQVQGSLV